MAAFVCSILRSVYRPLSLGSAANLCPSCPLAERWGFKHLQRQNLSEHFNPARLVCPSCTLSTVDVAHSADVADRADLPSLVSALEASASDLVRRALHGEVVELSLLICSDAYICELNKKWRDLDRPTDVLSFPQGDGTVLGDVIISLETAARQAEERGHTLIVELQILLVHGLLHLLGYDHETNADDLAEMAAAERKLLKDLAWDGVGLITASGSSVLHEDDT